MVFAAEPRRYYEIFEKPKEDFPDEADVHFPETEEEFRAMVMQMQREGFTE